MSKKQEKCPKHPTYKALRSPRSRCETCWRIFRINNSGYQTTGPDRY